MLTRVIATLLALALVGLGFGYRHDASVPTDLLLAGYLQAGGSLDALCGSDDPPPQERGPDCPVCTVAKSVALGAETASTQLAERIVAADSPRAGHLVVNLHEPRAPPARGPPAVPV